MAQIYNIDESFDYSLFDNASCAFGVFDGVHKGHRYLLECARETARKDNGKSIALTFDIDPDELFHADRLKKLMSNEQRIAMLAPDLQGVRSCASARGPGFPFRC